MHAPVRLALSLVSTAALGAAACSKKPAPPPVPPATTAPTTPEAAAPDAGAPIAAPDAEAAPAPDAEAAPTAAPDAAPPEAPDAEAPIAAADAEAPAPTDDAGVAPTAAADAEGEPTAKVAPPLADGQLGPLFGLDEEGREIHQPVKVGDLSIELRMPQDGKFLEALAGGKRIWAWDEPPAAGGSDFAITGWNDRRAALLEQSRIGAWVVDLLTGKHVEGFGSWAVSPDRTWAVVTPYYDGFTLCWQADRPARVRLDAEVAAAVIKGVAIGKNLLCSNDKHAEAESAVVTAAISADGTRYAYAATVDEPRIEVYDAADDHLVATLDQKLPPFEKVAFADDGKGLVLTHSDEAGKETSATVPLP